MFCVVKGAFVLALPAAVAERSATNFFAEFSQGNPIRGLCTRDGQDSRWLSVVSRLGGYGVCLRARCLVDVPRVCVRISYGPSTASLTGRPKMASVTQPTVIVSVTLASSDMTRALSRSFRIRVNKAPMNCDFIMPLPSRTGGPASLAILYLSRPDASPENVARVAALRRAFRKSLTMAAVDARGALGGFQALQDALTQSNNPPQGSQSPGEGSGGGGCHLLVPVLGGDAGADLAITLRKAFMEQGE